MVRKFHSRSLVLGLFLAITWASMVLPVKGRSPETVAITFALVIPVDPYSPGFTGTLSDYLSEQTRKIHFGDLAEVGDVLTFDSNSGTCGDIIVADSSWSLTHMNARIVNPGPDSLAMVYCPGSISPPGRSVLNADRITSVNACWIKINTSSGRYQTQPVADLSSAAALFIITAEFRAQK